MKQKPPNIILTVMDTVRADHLSCYGYDRETTPNIDRVARQGILYENAFSAAPWTPPSHASLFTGKYPSHHKTLGKDVCLRKENTTIAEVLSKNGYETLGVTCCQILGHGSGFEKGFDRYMEIKESTLSDFIRHGNSSARDLWRKMIHGPDKGTYQATQEIKGFVKESNAKNKPFFVFVNYFTCHTPYDPPSPFKKRFCKEFEESTLYFQEFVINTALKRSTEKIAQGNMNLQKLRWIANGGGGFSFAAKEASISEDEWKIVESWYDGEIAYLDHELGDLVNFLNDNDIFENTLMIITSDHGENFGEHGLAGHPLCLYDSLLHVPLIISYPAMMPQGQRTPSLVSLIDVYPTMLDAANGKDTEEMRDGRSLLPFDQQRKIHDFVCAEYGALHTKGFGGLKAWSLSPSTRKKLLKIDRGCKSIRNHTYKYILWSDKEELYNIREDPDETIDVSNEHPEVAQKLKKQLEKIVDVSYAGPQDFPSEQKEQILDRLRALGYV